MNNFKYIVIFILLIAFQAMLNGCFTFIPLIYISIVPAALVMLPYTLPAVPFMLIAFACGITVDALSDGVIGLNAAAYTAIAYLRKPVLAIVQGNGRFLENLIVYSIFFLVYLGLDGILSYCPGIIFLRFALNVALNSIFALIVQKLLEKQLK